MRAAIWVVLKYRIMDTGDAPVVVSLSEMDELMVAIGQHRHALQYMANGDDQRTEWRVEAYVLEALVNIAREREDARARSQ